MLATLPDASVQCCVTSPPNDGRFVKGERRSISTEFKPGQHWRPRKPHWEREWLVREYVELGRAAEDIAVEIGTTGSNVFHWLRKHGIARRTISEVRSVKHWGASGVANPMYGKTGPANPRYIDGSSPERQRLYVQGVGRAFLREVLARDGYRCIRCQAGNTGKRTLHVHHLRAWAGHPELRFDQANAVTLCRTCHGWVHSKRNASREFLA